MDKLQITGVALLVVALFVALDAYYYHQRPGQHDFRYAQLVSAISRPMPFSEKPNPPEHRNEKGFITEEQSVLYPFALSAFLAIVALGLSIASRVRKGPSPGALPLGFSSVLALGWLANTANTIGLLSNA